MTQPKIGFEPGNRLADLLKIFVRRQLSKSRLCFAGFGFDVIQIRLKSF
jgi:hypothetical protein